MKNKQNVLVGLYCLGFLVSGIFTLMLLTSNSVNIVNKILAGCMTLIFECGKGIFFIEAIRKKKIMLAMWISLTLLSIFASQAFMVNETNKIENISKISSSEYAQQQNKSVRINEQIQIKKDLLQKAFVDKENSKLDIEKYQLQINTKNAELKNAIARNYPDQITRIKSEVQQLVSLQVSFPEKKIPDLTTDIDNLNADLNAITYQVEYKSENGYVSLMQVLANLISCKVDNVIFVFYLFVTILFEVLICLLYYIASQNVSISTTPDIKPNETPIFLAKPICKKSETSFTKTSSIPMFDVGDIKKYIDCIYTHKKGNSCIGYLTISKITGLAQEPVRKIKGYLETLGILRTEGLVTKIVLEKDEAIKILKI